MFEQMKCYLSWRPLCPPPPPPPPPPMQMRCFCSGVHAVTVARLSWGMAWKKKQKTLSGCGDILHAFFPFMCDDRVKKRQLCLKK